MFGDKPREECGIFGIYAPGEDVSQLTFFGLHALQHRGQEAAGIAVADGTQIRLHKGVGLVSAVLTPQLLESLKGHYAIAHTRYSTLGSSCLRNAQPFLVETIHGQLAVAHNGNLINTAELRRRLLEQGVGLSSTSDSEVLTMMLAGSPGASWEDRIVNAMPEWLGAYSLVILTPDGVYAVRDPWGFRPLSVGRMPNGAHAVASESGALLTLGVEAIREVKPGEVVSLSNTALRVRQAIKPEPNLAYCTFEHIYFSRPDS
ncbi:MAG: amidophosphoribosyltransferase, partial [Anaerolineales bacterium]